MEEGDSFFFVFHDLEILGLGVQGEAYEGGDFVEALAAGGAGVDMEEVIVFVVHDTEDVTVSADEEVGLGELEGATQLVGVVPRPATDVRHEDTLPFDLEEGAFLEFVVQVEAVAVAPDGTHGLESPQFVEDAGADVAGMPQLVAVLEEGEDLRRQHPMGIAQNTYPFHSLAWISLRFSEIISLR